MKKISTYAAIDIGSNTVQLMLAQVQNKKIISNTNHITTTRLGATDANHNLTSGAIAKTAEAVAAFGGMAAQAKAEQLRIIATSAVRDANNKQELIAALAAKTDTAVEILTGEEEALMSFRGAKSNLDFPLGTPVIDVGGSSTELIYQLTDNDIYAKSINLGAVRMVKNGWSKEYMEQLIADSLSAKSSSSLAVGIGGTITAIAGVIMGLTDFERELIEGASVSKASLQELLGQLQPLSIQERRAYSPLLANRGEIIESGLLIWLALMERLNLKKILICGGGILDGAIADMV